MPEGGSGATAEAGAAAAAPRGWLGGTPLTELLAEWGSWTRAPLSTVMLDSLSASSSEDLRELDKQ